MGLLNHPYLFASANPNKGWLVSPSDWLDNSLTHAVLERMDIYQYSIDTIFISTEEINNQIWKLIFPFPMVA